MERKMIEKVICTIEIPEVPDRYTSYGRPGDRIKASDLPDDLQPDDIIRFDVEKNDFSDDPAYVNEIQIIRSFPETDEEMNARIEREEKLEERERDRVERKAKEEYQQYLELKKKFEG